MSLLLLVILMLILIVMVHWQLLNDFIIELDLSVCDLSFRDKVKFTYERDNGAGLITFYALSLTLPFLLMSLLDTLTVVCLITTHCIFHLISTLFHFLVLLINLLHLCMNVSNCDIDKYISLVSQGISTFP